MAKAKIDQFINSTRTVIVPLVFEHENQRQTDDFKVVYHTFSPRFGREIAAIESNENGNSNFAKSLAAIVVSIPEIIGADELPLPITEENLDAMDQQNLRAIYEAILKDVNPTATAKPEADTSAASPAISSAVASKV